MSSAPTNRRMAAEARAHRVRAMLYVLRAQIEAEKYEMRTLEIMRSAFRATEGSLDCPHRGKCRCKMLATIDDDSSSSDEDA